MDTKELRGLTKMARKIVERKTLKKINCVKDMGDKFAVLRHSMKSALDSRVYAIEMKLKILKKEKKNVFFVETKLGLLKAKLGLFYATWDKQDFEKMILSLKDSEWEVKNV